MNKIGKRILAAAVASSVLVTPVFADPSVDDLKKSKERAPRRPSRRRSPPPAPHPGWRTASGVLPPSGRPVRRPGHFHGNRKAFPPAPPAAGRCG